MIMIHGEFHGELHGELHGEQMDELMRRNSDLVQIDTIYPEEKNG
jgi:hypothetical protein